MFLICHYVVILFKCSLLSTKQSLPRKHLNQSYWTMWSDFRQRFSFVLADDIKHCNFKKIKAKKKELMNKTPSKEWLVQGSADVSGERAVPVAGMTWGGDGGDGNVRSFTPRCCFDGVTRKRRVRGTGCLALPLRRVPLIWTISQTFHR